MNDSSDNSQPNGCVLQIPEVCGFGQSDAGDVNGTSGPTATTGVDNSTGSSTTPTDSGPGGVNADDEVGPQDRQDLPTIPLGRIQLRNAVRVSYKAIADLNEPPVVFLRSGVLVRITADSTGPRIEPLRIDDMVGLLTRAVNFISVQKTSSREVFPPPAVARDMLANPVDLFPHLDAVVGTPVFTAAGKLCVEPGYHEEGRLWVETPEGFEIEPVPEHPTRADVTAALDLLLGDVLIDFPLAAGSDVAHAIGLLVLPFARRMINGCTPFHVVEAPTEGSGKGLIVQLAVLIATGSAVAGGSLPISDGEIRRRITSELASGRQFVIFDNLDASRRLQSASLASCLTMPTWSDRPLGRSKVVTLQNQAVWIATGNDVRLSKEIARRTVRIRIDPRMDKPWTRTGFRHPDLLGWVREERARVVRALLVLIQNWISKGRPVSDNLKLGSYESWAQVVGGIVTAAGVQGFGENLGDLHETQDTESDIWRPFLDAWYEEFGDRFVPVSALVNMCVRRRVLVPILGMGSERSRQIRLGNALYDQRDRVIGHYQIEGERNGHSKRHNYRVVLLAEMPDGWSVMRQEHTASIPTGVEVSNPS